MEKKKKGTRKGFTTGACSAAAARAARSEERRVGKEC